MTETATLDRPIVFGGAIKSLGGGRIGGYLVQFTSPDNKDLHGEYFTAKTKFHLDNHPIIGKPVLFNHGLTKQLGMKTYATFDKVEIDENGVYVEAQVQVKSLKDAIVEAKKFGEELDQERMQYLAYVDEIGKRRSKNDLSWSSGAFPQSVVVSKDGHIDEWIIVEGSETHTPANPTGTGIKNLKSITSDLGASIESPSAKETKDQMLDDLSSDLKTVVSDVSEIKRTIEGLDMQTKTKALDDSQRQSIRDRLADIKTLLDGDDNIEEIEADIIKDVDDKVAKSDSETITEKRFTELIDDAIENAFKRVNEEAERKESAKALAEKLKSQKQAPPVSKAPAYQSGGNTHVSVKSPYDSWTVEDMSYAIDLDRKLKFAGQTRLPIDFDEAYSRELGDKAIKGYQSGDIQLSPSAVKSFNAMKSDELVYSTQAGYGDEHVPTAWRDQIWERARRDNVVAPLFEVVEMPTSPYELPVEGTDPTVYFVAEPTDQSQMTLTAGAIPDSKIGTSKVTLTAKTLGLQVLISRTMTEDSVRGAIPKYRMQAQRAMLDTLDSSLLNGDTATSGNINYDGGTPPTTANYLIYNGLLKNAIVTATTNAVNAEGNSPTLQTIRQLRFKLDRNKQSVSDCVIIVHPEVEHVLLNIPEFLTIDKVGDRATNISGQIGVIDGMPVYVSNQMQMSDSDGKITYDGNVANRGRIAVVHKRSWFVGYRRQLDFDYTPMPWLDSHVMTVTMRPAFVGQDNDSVAVLYNVGI